MRRSGRMLSCALPFEMLDRFAPERHPVAAHWPVACLAASWVRTSSAVTTSLGLIMSASWEAATLSAATLRSLDSGRTVRAGRRE